MTPARRTLARRLAFPALWVVAGGAVGFALRDRLPEGRDGGPLIEVRNRTHQLISPLLECDSARDSARNRALSPFKERVEAQLRDLRRAGAERVAVYFRELNDGLWFSVNEELSFSPASMRKVPMLIAVLKQAERTPDLLSREIVANLQQDHDARQNFKPSAALEPGRKYPVGELLTRMIVHSDNNAFMLVSAIVDRQELADVYDLLSMRPPTPPREEAAFSVLTYASFFRILFNGTYLSKELSAAALEQLARAEFRSGIVAGVPESVLVAHKFGERSDEATGEKQLHDCGIVYYPQRPYLLCVMTKGRRFEDLAAAIASISRRVFDEVDAQRRAAE